MNSLTEFLRKLQSSKVLIVFLTGILLCLTSIVSSNGQYTLEANKLAQLDINSQFLIAANKSDGLLYPGAETPQGRLEKEKELPIKTLKSTNQAQPGGFNQRDSDLGNRVEGRIEAAKETFEEASSFLQDKADEASARPELKKNPALGK